MPVNYEKLVLLVTALVLILYPAVSIAQKGKKTEPECQGRERVCNALIQFPDKVVDQGRYCNGCVNCSAPVELRSGNSFLWQHFEHARMRVQFLKCSDFRPVGQCRPSDIKAAVFVSPRNSWEPVLEQIYCRCPPAAADGPGGAPLFYLLGWHLEAEQWVYEFGCQLRQCSTGRNPTNPTPIKRDNRLIGGVCARKRKLTEDGPVDVKFACLCPPDYRCYVSEQDEAAKEQQQPAGASAGGSGGDSGGSGNDARDSGSSGRNNNLGFMDSLGAVQLEDLNTDWRQVRDDVTGGLVFEKAVRCQKRLVNQTSST